MNYYIQIKNNEIISHSNLPIVDEDVINFKTSEKFYNSYIANPELYKAENNKVVRISEDEEKELERQHILSLTCTKRVFALMLQELGISYNQLKELIAENDQAQLEWDLCVELLRSNPLLDVMAIQLKITSDQLDKLFLYANGEITLEDFKGGV